MSSHEKAAARPPRSLLDRFRVDLGALPWRDAILAGSGGLLAVFTLASLTLKLDTLLLIAPFGASCVLVFAIPHSPLAQPRNVIGGHVLSTIAGLSVLYLLGATPLAFGLGVGLAICAMALTGLLHPPAGADPIVVMLAGASWRFLFTPVLLGATVIVLIAIGFHRWITRKPYPLG